MTTSTALLVVGMTNGYFDRAFVPEPVVESRTRALQGCATALQIARKHNWPVAFAPRVYEPDGANIEFMRVKNFQAARERTGRFPLQRGEPDTLQYRAELATLADDIVVERRCFSAFFATDLAQRLHARGVKRVVVIGANAGTCVRASIFDAISHGFEAVTVRDALADTSPETLEATLTFFARDLQIPIHGSMADATAT
jgi:nicotinamidase-related amidase